MSHLASRDWPWRNADVKSVCIYVTSSKVKETLLEAEKSQIWLRNDTGAGISDGARRQSLASTSLGCITAMHLGWRRGCLNSREGFDNCVLMLGPGRD